MLVIHITEIMMRGNYTAISTMVGSRSLTMKRAEVSTIIELTAEIRTVTAITSKKDLAWTMMSR